jgi:hypothetical protein
MRAERALFSRTAWDSGDGCLEFRAQERGECQEPEDRSSFFSTVYSGKPIAGVQGPLVADFSGCEIVLT